MGEYLDLLIESLRRIEAVTDRPPSIEINIARVNIGAFLGEEWVEKYVLPRSDPHPWMLNGIDWVGTNTRDIRRALHAYRVVRLSDALFTIAGKLEGFDVLRQRFRRRTDLRALFAELEIASLLVRNKVSVKLIGKSGKKGQDFDLLATVRGMPVSVEVTSINETTVMSAHAIVNKLNHKRNQVPASRPAILYLLVPDQWMRNYTSAFLILNAALARFMRTSRRFNAVILTWERVDLTGGISIRRLLQAVYNNNPRFHIPDLSVFGMMRNKWGLENYGNSLLTSLRAYRLREEMKRDIGSS